MIRPRVLLKLLIFFLAVTWVRRHYMIDTYGKSGDFSLIYLCSVIM